MCPVRSVTYVSGRSGFPRGFGRLLPSCYPLDVSTEHLTVAKALHDQTKLRIAVSHPELSVRPRYQQDERTSPRPISCPSGHSGRPPRESPSEGRHQQSCSRAHCCGQMMPLTHSEVPANAIFCPSVGSAGAPDSKLTDFGADEQAAETMQQILAVGR
jgi:hypothetical protein